MTLPPDSVFCASPACQLNPIHPQQYQARQIWILSRERHVHEPQPASPVRTSTVSAQTWTWNGQGVHDLGTSCLAASVVMEAPLASGTQRKRLHFGVLQNLPLPIVSALSPHITPENTWMSNSLTVICQPARRNCIVPDPANRLPSGMVRVDLQGSGCFHQDICLLKMNQTSTKATRLSESDARARETGKSLRDKSLVHAMLRK
ncbi:hypothetical protein JMJ77_0007986 [Colletotrichum scovillei]|uniref:Uncharacterized protein n=1 Tax=Colletotrichum scovillei TaxID=1209932 RepID=A0A9P7RGB2_9PEZI|nr:hypothetical protein JMJ77_0007986 [Colletotrichum scovillei]KAG7074964.1 hypothetical protein JMJ76_0011429 [Colletotrichum scovillei]KAG7082030.1 hypothetical protein JMJ78_0004137 [Colletotrichum scovillei]